VALASLWSVPPGMRAQSNNQAALVIRHGQNDVRTACVEFDEPQISGYELLQRSGFDLQIGVQGLGPLVCNIGGTGCPASDCLCHCKGGGECVYWSYWHRLDGSWQYSQGGASVYMVASGAVEGWSWGPGALNQAVPPPNIKFDEVCQTEAINTPAPAPSATNTQPAAMPDSVVIVQRAKTAAAETNPGQDTQMIGAPTAAPPFPLTENGESGVHTVGADLGAPDIADQDSRNMVGSDSLPYLIFLVIVAGLVGLLWFVSFRRKQL